MRAIRRERYRKRKGIVQTQYHAVFQDESFGFVDNTEKICKFSYILIMSRMGDSKLRLPWRDHGNELSRLSRDVFCREDLSDVTLTCRGGAPFSAHKMILAAASTYFRNFFMEVRGKTNQHQVIFMIFRITAML